MKAAKELGQKMLYLMSLLERLVRLQVSFKDNSVKELTNYLWKMLNKKFSSIVKLNGHQKKIT